MESMLGRVSTREVAMATCESASLLKASTSIPVATMELLTTTAASVGAFDGWELGSALGEALGKLLGSRDGSLDG